MALPIVTLALAAPAQGYIYYGETAGGHSVARANLDGTGVKHDFLTGFDWSVNAVAVDDAHVYVGALNGSIGRADINGGSYNPNFITGGNPNQIATDSSYIYWAAGSTINRSNLDGSGTTVLVTGIDVVGGVAVDSTYVYWAVSGTGGAGTTIGRAKLNGTEATQSFITGASQPTTVAVDAAHIYWANKATGKIGRADIGGTNVNQAFISATNVCGVAVNATHVYWASGSQAPGDPSAIGRANLDGSAANPSLLPTSGGGWTGLGCPIAVDALLPPPAASMTLTPSQDQIFYGQPLSVLATVSGGPSTPAGSVTFSVLNAPPANVTLDDTGSALFDPDYYFDVGDDVTATYSGDETHGPTSTMLELQIQPAVTTTTVLSSANPATEGTEITLTARVRNSSTDVTPYGTVQFLIDGEPVLEPIVVDGNGEAAIVGTPGAGDFTVEARYQDASGIPANFVASQGALAQHVIPSAATSTTASTTIPTAPASAPPAPVLQPIVARCKVPRLKGLKLVAAKRALVRAHCQVGKVSRRKAKRRQRGRVIGTKPGAGRTTTGTVAVTVGR